jgi:hypothetical protein
VILSDCSMSGDIHDLHCCLVRYGRLMIIDHGSQYFLALTDETMMAAESVGFRWTAVLGQWIRMAFQSCMTACMLLLGIGNNRW